MDKNDDFADEFADALEADSGADLPIERPQAQIEYHREDLIDHRVDEPRGESDYYYYFYPTWRSQLVLVFVFLLLCYLTVVAVEYMPYLVISDSLFVFNSTKYYLSLPLPILFPGAVLGRILYNIYNARFIIDQAGVEAQVGLVSLKLRQPRLRYEDIRGVEPQQTIWERLLGIGSLLIGSAMTKDVEIVMEGVANPRAIQLIINEERDRRLRSLKLNDREMALGRVSGD